MFNSVKCSNFDNVKYRMTFDKQLKLYTYHRNERQNMTAIPRKMHPSCFIPSFGSVSLTSSGNTDTKAETIKSMMRMMMDGFEVEVTDVEETSGGEWQNPGSPGFQRVD